MQSRFEKPRLRDSGLARTSITVFTPESRRRAMNASKDRPFIAERENAVAHTSSVMCSVTLDRGWERNH